MSKSQPLRGKKDLRDHVILCTPSCAIYFLKERSLAMGKRCLKVDNVLLHLLFQITCRSESTLTVAHALPSLEVERQQNKEAGTMGESILVAVATAVTTMAAASRFYGRGGSSHCPLPLMQWHKLWPSVFTELGSSHPGDILWAASNLFIKPFPTFVIQSFQFILPEKGNLGDDFIGGLIKVCQPDTSMAGTPP